MSADPILAGLTFLTAFNLKHSDDEHMVITHGRMAHGSYEGKYVGRILTLEGRPYVTSSPRFDTPEAAEEHMRKVVAAARAWDGSMPEQPDAVPLLKQHVSVSDQDSTREAQEVRDEEEI